jgi:hypothetical protein
VLRRGGGLVHTAMLRRKDVERVRKGCAAAGTVVGVVGGTERCGAGSGKGADRFVGGGYVAEASEQAVEVAVVAVDVVVEVEIVDAGVGDVGVVGVRFIDVVVVEVEVEVGLEVGELHG